MKWQIKWLFRLMIMIRHWLMLLYFFATFLSCNAKMIIRNMNFMHVILIWIFVTVFVTYACSSLSISEYSSQMTDHFSFRDGLMFKIILKINMVCWGAWLNIPDTFRSSPLIISVILTFMLNTIKKLQIEWRFIIRIDYLIYVLMKEKFPFSFDGMFHISLT